MKERYYELIDERVFEQELENGLRLFVIPKPGFQKTFVTYTTQFGSLDNQFKPLGQDQFVTVPDGVAHFLEHKLFEKKKKTYLLRLLKIMHKQMRLQALIVQATCSVQLIILKTTLNVYLQWLKRLILQKKLLIKKRYYCRRNKNSIKNNLDIN